MREVGRRRARAPGTPAAPHPAGPTPVPPRGGGPAAGGSYTGAGGGGGATGLATTIVCANAAAACFNDGMGRGADGVAGAATLTFWGSSIAASWVGRWPTATDSETMNVSAAAHT